MVASCEPESIHLVSSSQTVLSYKDVPNTQVAELNTK
jgi:hypothetical protein